MVRIVHIGLWLILLVALHAATAQASSSSLTLQRAHTLHRLALALEVDSEAMRAAADEYAKVVADPESSDAHRIAAQAGLDQTTARLENSDEMFRNVWPRAWMMHGDHEVYEWYDSHTELALDRAWSELQDQLILKDHPVLPLLTRCKGDSDTCEILRDMVFLASQEAPHLQALSDDHLQLLSSTPILLGEVGQPPTSFRALSQTIPEPDVVLLDITIHPEMEWKSDPVSMVSLHAQRLSDSGAITTLGHSYGVGVDVISRWTHRPLLLLLLGVVIALGASVVELRRESRARSAFWGIASVLGGGWLLSLSVELTDQWFPAMDSLAWDPNANPLLPSIAWPLLQAIVLVAGPLLGAVVAKQLIQQQLGNFLDASLIRWAYVPLFLQVGAMTALVSDLPTLFGGVGWLDALSLIVAMGSMMALLSPLAWQSLNAPDGHGTPVVSIAAGGGASLLAFVMFTLGSHALVVLGIGIIGTGLVWANSHTKEEEALPDAPEGTKTGTRLRVARFIERDTQGVEVMAAQLLTPSEDTTSSGSIVQLEVLGPSGIGKTRWCHELLKQLQDSLQDDAPVVRDSQPVWTGWDSDDAQSTPAYQTITELLERILPVLEKVSVYEGGDELPIDPLDLVPGVGLLAGVMATGRCQVTTSERIRADVIKSLCAILRKRPVIWFVDDIQGADEESLSILNSLQEELHERVAAEGWTLAHRLFLITARTTDARFPAADLPVSAQHQRMTLHGLTGGEVDRLVEAIELQPPSDEQRSWLLQHGNTPGELLSVLNYVSAREALRQTPEGLSLPSVERLAELGMPTELRERELARIDMWRSCNDLDDADLLLLECAAQSGRTFNTRTLAAGLSRDHLEVLGRLEVFENQLNIVSDLGEGDDFIFCVRPTREALVYRSMNRCEQDSELPLSIRIFHETAAGSLRQRIDERDDDCSAESVYHHYRNAGARHEISALEWAVRAAEEARDRFAWTRAGEWVERASGALSPTWRDRRQYVQACAFLRAETELPRARSELKRLLNSPHIDTRRCLLDWLEAMYQANEQRALLEYTSARQSWPEQWMAETAGFYSALAQARLGELDPRAVILRLRELRGQLCAETESEGASEEYRQMICARVENHMGNVWTRIQGKTAAEDTEMRQMLHSSLQRKELLGDREGMGHSYAAMGRLALYVDQDPDKAEECFESNLSLLRETGTRMYIPQTLNHLGEAFFLHFKKGGAPSEEHFSQSLSYSRQSLTMALKMHSPDSGKPVGLNVFFAIKQILTVLDARELPTTSLEALLGDERTQHQERVIAQWVAEGTDSPLQQRVGAWL